MNAFRVSLGALAVCLAGVVGPPVVAADGPDVDEIVTLLDLVLEADEATARQCLGTLTTAIQNGTVDRSRVEGLRAQLGERMGAIVRDTAHPLRFEAALLAAAWKDADSLRVVRQQVEADGIAPERRIAALQALVVLRDPGVVEIVDRIFSQPDRVSVEVRGQLLGVLGRSEDPELAGILLARYAQLEADLRPRVIELLTQRPMWSKPLLASIQAKQIDKDALNLNQLRRIATFKDEGMQTTLTDIYGAIRDGRDPNREQVFYKTRDFLNGTPGHPANGEAVFKKLCAQCHKLYGEGAEVGPDITRNGRNNWDQLLWNVLDPSQVIGPGYQARILITTDGRTLTGLPVEESDQRVVLKVQGGKQESIPRDQIEIYKVSELSMMPDQLERQLTPQELADLLSFLAHDRHPSDPEAKLLPGAPAPRR